MATVTVVQPAPKFTLELDTSEALYVHHALRLTTPIAEQFAGDAANVNNDPTFDPVYEALSDAIEGAGLPQFNSHAAVL